MKLRRESEYGVAGLIALADAGAGAVLALDEIAIRRGLPRGFLAKIFARLVRYGLVRSFRGAVRGYALAKPAREITLREILEALEGPDLFGGCLFRSDRCDGPHPCPLHGAWAAARSVVVEIVERTTLAGLAAAPASRRAPRAGGHGGPVTGGRARQPRGAKTGRAPSGGGERGERRKAR